MVSLKDFKKFEVEKDSILKIKGGIECDDVWGVLTYLSEHNKAQFDVVANQLMNGGIQCTKGGEWFNMTHY